MEDVGVEDTANKIREQKWWKMLEKNGGKKIARWKILF
jgi:hypothetical protein